MMENCKFLLEILLAIIGACIAFVMLWELLLFIFFHLGKIEPPIKSLFDPAMVDNIDTKSLVDPAMVDREPPYDVDVTGDYYAFIKQGHILVSPERFQEAVNIAMSTIVLGQKDDPVFEEYTRLREAVLKAVGK